MRGKGAEIGVHTLSQSEQGRKSCAHHICEFQQQKQKVAVVGVKCLHILQVHSILTAKNVQVFNNQAARVSFPGVCGASTQLTTLSVGHWLLAVPDRPEQTSLSLDDLSAQHCYC